MKDETGRVQIPHFYDEAMQPGRKELAAMQNDHGPNESLPVRNLILGIETSAALPDALGR